MADDDLVAVLLLLRRGAVEVLPVRGLYTGTVVLELQTGDNQIDTVHLN